MPSASASSFASPQITVDARDVADRARPSNDAADALMALAAELFREPDRIDVHCWYRFRRRFPILLHSHPDILQLGALVGCGGTFTIGPDTMHLRGGSIALCAYPREPHAHELLPAGPDGEGEILGIKIRVDPSWPAVRLRLFERFTYPITGEVVLLRALRRLMRLSPATGTPGPVVVARVVEVLSIWPGAAAQQDIPETGAVAQSLEKPLCAALERIDRNLANPPSVAELASLAGLSPRHFSRRFAQALGVTPHKLIDSRRLTRAKELLLREDMTVAEVAEVLGFDSLQTFSRWFAQRAGTPPSRLRRAPVSL
jgi:AraC-like DNA-binding protein